MAPLRSRSRPWLLAMWVAGTAAAVAIVVVAVNLAGAEVTARPIPTVSRHEVEEALAGDATTLTAGHDDTATDETTDATDDHGGTGSGSSGVSGSPDDRSGVSGTSGGSGTSGSGSSGGSGTSGSGSTGSSGSDDGQTGTGSSGGSGSDTSGGSGSTPGGGGSTPTTAPAAATFSTAAAGNSVTVRCSGATVSLVSTTAVDGWAKQIRKSGPDEVDVRFTNGAGDHVEVKATCSASVVRWSS